jgi:hypothetical protein
LKINELVEQLVQERVREVLKNVISSGLGANTATQMFGELDVPQKNEKPVMTNHGRNVPPKHKILSFLLDSGQANIQDLEKGTGMERNKLKYYLKKLRKDGDVRMTGERRSSVYFPG